MEVLYNWLPRETLRAMAAMVSSVFVVFEVVFTIDTCTSRPHMLCRSHHGDRWGVFPCIHHRCDGDGIIWRCGLV